MFPTTDLIQLVFADEEDTIYAPNLMKLRLDQYLTLKLGGMFREIYFVRLEDEAKYILNYTAPDGRETRLKGLESSWKWLRDKMNSKNCALVFPLREFCHYFNDGFFKEGFRLFGGKSREEQLKDIAFGSAHAGIILKVPACVEDSRSLFRSSAIFKVLDMTEIKCLYPEAGCTPVFDCYRELRRRSACCVFLNAYTEKQVYALLLHVTMQFPKRFESCERLSAMSRFLTQYLNHRAMQWETVLFETDFSLASSRYQQLYEQLTKETVWKRLVDASQNPLCFRPVSEVRTMYKNPVFMQCLDLRPFYAGETAAFPESQEKILDEIQEQLCRPCSCEENDSIFSEMQEFLNRTREAEQRKDSGTYHRGLYAIAFCLHYLYTRNAERKILQMTATLKEYLHISANAGKFGSISQADTVISSYLSGFSLSESENLQKFAQELNTMMEQIQMNRPETRQQEEEFDFSFLESGYSPPPEF